MQWKSHKTLLSIVFYWLFQISVQGSTINLACPSPIETDTSDWSRVFYGWKSELLTFTMHLDRKGEALKGYYVYDHSTDTFLVEGVLDGKALWLEERFQEVEDCGLFQGKFDGTTFEGTWNGSSALGVLAVYFSDARPLEELRMQPALYTFTTKLKDLSGKWMLFTDMHKTARGFFTSMDKQVYQIKLQSIQKDEHQAGKIGLILLNEYFEPVYRVTLNLKSKTISFEGVDYPIAKLKQDLEIVRRQVADFHQLRVNLSIPALDRYAAAMTIFRDTACNLNFRRRYVIANRGNIFSATTFYPTYVNGKTISGLLTKQVVIEDQTCLDEVTVNFFNPRSNQTLQISNEVVNQEKWEQELESFVNQHVQKVKSLKPSDPYWQALQAEDFQHLVLGDNGLLVAKGQDPYLGVLFIPLPSSLIVQNFNKKSRIYQLMQSKVKL